VSLKPACSTAESGDRRNLLAVSYGCEEDFPSAQELVSGGRSARNLPRAGRGAGLRAVSRETRNRRSPPLCWGGGGGEGSVNAHNSGRVSGLDLLFAKLGVHQNAMVPLELSVEEDNLGQKLVFVVAEDFGETVPDELPDDRPPPSQEDALGPIGRPYTNVGQLPQSAPMEPFDVDPDNVDRGKQAHASTQDALADFLLITARIF
jgi:hypothetical protein